MLIAQASAQTLERVVIVERHGVRAPTKTPKALSAFSAQPFPAWPVAPGELTPHGAAAIRLMGGWLRRHYAAAGLVPAAGCPAAGSVFVWADGHDNRTRQSGDAVLDGAFPGCGLTADHAPPAAPDPIFDAAETGACKPDPQAARASVLAAMPGGLANPVPDYKPALAALSVVLDPAGRACNGCLAGDNTIAASGKGVKIQGPLATGATIGEALALEYAEGMQGAALGWGRLDAGKLASVMALHNGYSDLTRRDPVIAGHNGALLARAVLAAIDGGTAFPGQGHPARLTIILGHDTSLANLAGIFGVKWTLPGQPDNTPPDGALVFEVYGPAPVVKLSVVYQTADQLRALSPLAGGTAPGRVDLAPGCAASGCSAGDLHRIVDAVVPASCKFMPGGAGTDRREE